ncbi:MAG: peptide deformylase [Bulleidia sp.]
MIRSIEKDPVFLSVPSAPAGKEDLAIVRDLLDTMAAHEHDCLGMAANMIGFQKQIICVRNGPVLLALINPVIVRKQGSYEAEEGCLSLSGTRKTRRFQKISVKYQDAFLKTHQQDFSGLAAEVIQHECDHLKGILI